MRPFNSAFYLTALVLCLVGAWVVIALDHIRSGKGFARLHLEVSSDITEDLSAITVNAISTTGNAEPMSLTRNHPGLWSLKRFTGNIQKVQVLGKDPLFARKLTLVAGWEDKASPRYTISPLTVTPISDTNHQFRGFTLTRATPASNLPRFQHSLNWHGDIWFILVTLAKAIVVTIATLFTLRLSAGLFLTSDSSVSFAPKLIASVSTKHFVLALTYGFAAILLIQIYHRLSQGKFDFRDPLQQMALSIVQGFIIVLGLGCLKFCADSQRAIYAWATVLIALFSIKALWLTQVTTLQCSDYGIYWSYGQSMAAGDWDKLNSESPLSLVLIRRSWAWCSWIAKVFGSTATSLKLANFLLQIATAILFSWHVKHRFGNSVMAGAMVAFLLYPESWFSSTIASHDLPALFWFTVLTIAVDLLQQRLLNPISTYRFWLSLFWRACAVGTTIAILNIQRDFGIFSLLALSLMSAGWITLSIREPKEFLRRAVLAATAASVVMIACSIAGKTLEYQIRSRYSTLQNLSTLAFITSVESRGRPSWDQMQPWRFLYYPAIPDSEKFAFTVSKLSHEKIVRIDDYRKQILENAKQLGDSGGLIDFAFGGSAGNFNPDGPIPWKSFFLAASVWLETCLALLFILRILLSWKTGLFNAEIFPLLFCITQTVAIILLSEVNPSYDSFLVVPFSLAAGILIGWSSQTQITYSPVVTCLNIFRSNLTRTIYDNANSILATTVAFALLLTADIPITPPFLSPASVNIIKHSPSNTTSVNFDEDGIYITTDDLTIEKQEICSEQRLSVEWNINCKANKPMHFFLAGNQRKLKITHPPPLNPNDSTAIALAINGEIHFKGVLSDLKYPLWQSFTPSSSPAKFKLTVLKTKDTETVTFPQGLSVEYFWQPR
jgi:hypothetical protein